MPDKKKEYHAMSIRMPLALYEKIEKECEDNFRYTTQQMIMILTEYYKDK